MTVIRSAYDPSVPVRLMFEGDGMTQQSFKDQCDINNILKRFEATGLAEHVKEFAGSYGDFTNAPADYHTAMNSVVNAQQMFETLPAKLRKRFGNDPGDFLTFVDTATDEQMREVGLLPPSVIDSAPSGIDSEPAPAVEPAVEPVGADPGPGAT